MCENEVELWKDVEGYVGIYQVSNLGNVRSLDRITITKNNKRFPFKGKKINPTDNGIGYLVLGLMNSGRKAKLLHRLVAVAFIDNPNNYPDVNHLDGNKRNCRADNLEWCTHKENIRHSMEVLGFNPHKINRDKVGALNWNSKEVKQYDRQGNYIATFGSTTEAHRMTGIDCSLIGRACRGERNHAGGYLFKYSQAS